MLWKRQNMILNLISVFVFYCLFVRSLSALPTEICESSGECKTRNTDLALSLGRRCRRHCSPNFENSCKNNFICMYARECGYSCINLAKECPSPPNIPNMSRAVIYRKSPNGCYSQMSTSRYMFDDMLVYECQPGYSLLYPTAKHYCTGRAQWTHEGHSVCVSNSCPPPTMIANMSRTVVYRKNPSGSYSKISTSRYMFDDMLVYECKPGYSLLYPTAKHYCTEEGRWSYEGHSVCVESGCCVSRDLPNTQSSNRERSIAVGTSISYSCDRDYIIANTENRRLTRKTVECQSHGVLSTSIPECIRLDPCNSNPCMNGGTCMRNGHSYLCFCHPQIKGRRCENIANHCFSTPCQNGGTCVRTSGSYRCDCPQGYGTRNCDRKLCTLENIPSHISIRNQNLEGIYYTGDLLTMECRDSSRILSVGRSTITCVEGESWKPDYRLVRCI